MTSLVSTSLGMGRFPVFLLILIQIIWAVNYVLSKVILNTVPGMLWVWLKNGLASVILVVIALLLGRRHPPLSRDFWIPLVLFSLLGSILTQSFFVLGLANTTAINSAVLSSITPMATLSLVACLGLEKPNFLQILGLILSLIGILIFCRIDEFHIVENTIMGDCFIIISSICYGLYFALSKSFLTRFDPLWIAAWFCILTTLSTTGFVHDDILTLSNIQITPFMWIATIYNVVFVTVLGYFLVIWAISCQSALAVAHYEYLQPVITAFLAYLFLRESLDLRGFIGAILILLGLGFSFQRQKT